ncbi:MAG: ribokinase, partial [Oscillospiraceae bacterium]|nr:ribokinase [Oscillospiraceae bacterium]
MARTPHLPAPAETVKGSFFKQGAGGKGFNQGIAAHKAGGNVVMITKLGRDSMGKVATDAMDEVGLSKDYLFYSDEVATGIALIMVDENTSQNEIVIVPGACS